MELKGSKTEENLKTAFAGESQARNKYTFFASKARKDGFVQIAKIFEETAENEKEHAKLWYKYLNDGIKSTAENFNFIFCGAFLLVYINVNLWERNRYFFFIKSIFYLLFYIIGNSKIIVFFYPDF